MEEKISELRVTPISSCAITHPKETLARKDGTAIYTPLPFKTEEFSRNVEVANVHSTYEFDMKMNEKSRKTRTEPRVVSRRWSRTNDSYATTE